MQVAKNVQEEYADVMAESCETDPFPPYNPSTCLLGVLKYPNREAAERCGEGRGGRRGSMVGCSAVVKTTTPCISSAWATARGPPLSPSPGRQLGTAQSQDNSL